MLEKLQLRLNIEIRNKAIAENRLQIEKSKISYAQSQIEQINEQITKLQQVEKEKQQIEQEKHLSFLAEEKRQETILKDFLTKNKH